jgi:hypothetical protein
MQTVEQIERIHSPFISNIVSGSSRKNEKNSVNEIANILRENLGLSDLKGKGNYCMEHYTNITSTIDMYIYISLTVFMNIAYLLGSMNSNFMFPPVAQVKIYFTRFTKFHFLTITLIRLVNSFYHLKQLLMLIHTSTFVGKFLLFNLKLKNTTFLETDQELWLHHSKELRILVKK